jgi:hypothetical protein
MSKLAFRRVRGDAPHATDCAVLLVALCDQPSAEAIDRAVGLAGGGTIAVLALLKIHGYGLGMPNPGLMPTAKERAARREVVADVIARIERDGGHADGQVTATRNPTRTIATVARDRQARQVVIDRQSTSRLRRSLEGDVAASTRRRLRARAEVIVIESEPGGSPAS